MACPCHGHTEKHKDENKTDTQLLTVLILLVVMLLIFNGFAIGVSWLVVRRVTAQVSCRCKICNIIANFLIIYIICSILSSTTSFGSICDRYRCGWKTFTCSTAGVRKQIDKQVKKCLEVILLIPPRVLLSLMTILHFHLMHRTSRRQRTVPRRKMTSNLASVRLISLEELWYQQFQQRHHYHHRDEDLLSALLITARVVSWWTSWQSVQYKLQLLLNSARRMRRSQSMKLLFISPTMKKRKTVMAIKR